VTGDPTGGFDRLRRRTGRGVVSGHVPAARDPLGTSVFFSPAEQRPAFGAVTLACSACGRTSVVGPSRALRLAVPSLHLPLVRRGHPSWMRCPECGRRTWVRLGVTL
jgi:hypothetical protein